MRSIPLCACLCSLSAACAAAGDPGSSIQKGRGDSSAIAEILEFEFSGRVWGNRYASPEKLVEDQLLYSVGQLNGDDAVGRLDKLEIDSIETDNQGDRVSVEYRARMPVAWAGNGSPSSYELILPVDLTSSGKDRFLESYQESCVEWGAHDVSSGNLWYYFRPDESGCALDENDVMRARATVSPSPLATTGKYPEYHKVWEDDALRVLAVIGKDKSGATENSDMGIRTYNKLYHALQDLLAVYGPTTTPEITTAEPGIAFPDITLSTQLPDGRWFEATILLVDSVRSAGPEFVQRYETLSGSADFIAYGGHSGLGANIREMANRGRWVSGQYTIVFMDGCDTYAYVDSALADAHAAVNPDDPVGTRYVDVVTNALPSPWGAGATNVMAFVEALLRDDDPLTFERIFEDVGRSQVVLVSGEEDNVFVPGYPSNLQPDPSWDGLEESGELLRAEEANYQTPILPEGTYEFRLSGTGDGDLYVRLGEAPTVDAFDCRPFRLGSSELCRVEVGSPVALHLMVRGEFPRTTFQLTGARIDL